MTQGAPVQSLTSRLRALVQQEKVSLPPLPEVGARLLRLLEDDDSGVDDVVKLLRHEPALVATVLKTANSAAFGGLHPITELSQAVPRLGMRQVASIVTALVHKGHFQAGEPDKRRLLRQLWDHAVATAMAARHLSGVCGGNGEEAFLAGLLHDVGKLLVLKGVDHLQRGAGAVEITPALLAEMMAELHTELGQRTLRDWGLPEPICDVARCHHQESVPSEDTLLLRVQAANAVSRKKAAHPDPGPDLPLDEVAAVEQLGLSDLELAALLVDLEDELEAARQLF